MAYEISKVDVWAADIANQAGTLARLLEQLSGAGANLEFMIARKVDEGTSRVFVAPIKGAKIQKAATAAGLSKAAGLYSLRIEGPNKPGLGARLTSAIGEKGINLRGASAAGLGKSAVFYFAVNSEQDLKSATQVARKALAK